MNIVFWLLIIILIGFIWLSFAFSFRWIGKISRKIFKDTKTKINKEDKEKE